MKKAIYLIETVAMVALLLTGCKGKKSSDNTPKKEITYRSWDYGTEGQDNEERQLIRAFEEKENVKVNIVENVGDGNFYWDGIKASVANGIDLADVMMVPNLDWPLAAQYLYNVKDLVNADEEFAKVPAAVRDACTFKSGIYALPARMNLQGYFINTKLIGNTLGIETKNINVNSPYSVIEDIINAAAANPNVVGLNSPTHYIDTMASVLDASGKQGYFTWDGEQYHLDEEPFIQGVQKARELFDAHKTLDAYTDEEKLTLGLDPEIDPKVDAWNKGKLAIRYGATYEIADMLQSNTIGNSYKFIGNPGGKITIIGDYYGIYKETKEPELAYKFAKWMSFGLEGFQKRMEIFDKNEKVINTLPLQNNTSLIDKYFELFGSSTDMSGLEAAYEYIQTKSMVEGVKVVPGYLSSRQNKKTGISITLPDSSVIENATMFELLNSCVVFGKNIADYVTGPNNIDTIADQQYTKWMETYGSKYE